MGNGSGGLGSLVNLGGAIPAAQPQASSSPRPILTGIQPPQISQVPQPARPVPPMQIPLGKLIIISNKLDFTPVSSANTRSRILQYRSRQRIPHEEYTYLNNIVVVVATLNKYNDNKI